MAWLANLDWILIDLVRRRLYANDAMASLIAFYG